MTADRASRRRQARADARAGRPPLPVMMVGDGMVAAGLGDRFEARPSADLPAKVPGQHRYVASATWILPNHDAAQIMDADLPKFLDNENMMLMAVWCWDCETPAPAIVPGAPCPAEAAP